MKFKILSASAACALIFATACGKTETSTVTTQTEKGSGDSKKIEVEYSYSEKPKFVAKLKSELAEVNTELKNLGDKIAASTETAKADAKPKYEALKEKAKNLDVYVEKAENATESTWNDVKAGSQKALDDAKAGFTDARQWLSDKIAPK